MLRSWALDGHRPRVVERPEVPVDALTLALSPDGRVLAAGDRSGGVTLIDAERGVVLNRGAAPAETAEPPISAVAFAPGGTMLALGDQQGKVSLWALHASAPEALRGADPPTRLVSLPGHRGPVAALAFDAQGHHLATASTDRTVDVWDLARVHDALKRLGLGW